MRLQHRVTIAVTAFVLAVACVVIHAAPPPSLPAPPPLSDTDANDADDQQPVKYDGAQLWRVPFDRLQERNAVADLQNTFGEPESLVFRLFSVYADQAT